MIFLPLLLAALAVLATALGTRDVLVIYTVAGNTLFPSLMWSAL